MMKKIIALMLCFVLALTLCACAKEKSEKNDENIEVNQNDDQTVKTENKAPADTSKTDDDKEANSNNSAESTEKMTLSVGFLKGPTGIGAAYMMEQNENGQARINYDITVDSDVSNINSAIISGALDIAAVPTNVASVLYNKTEGNIQIVAINTLGVLYILENGDSIAEVSDLSGKTIYATGQGSNPQYVLEYILSQNGLTVGEDVFIEYMAADEVAAKMVSGTIDICMLPVPNATSVMMKNSDVRSALSLKDEWESITNGSSILTQGCVVARKDRVTDEELDAFLSDYYESIDFMANEENLDEAAALAAKYEIVAAEAVAKAAIPDCNLTYIADADTMREYLSDYFMVLFTANPTSIGGSVPDDAFYRNN